nr:hypothetical protein CFP56_44203 [Quercus suber]
MAGFSSKRRKIRQPDSEFPLLKLYYQELFPVSKLSVSARDTVLDLRFQKLTCFPKLPKLRNLKQLELELNRRVVCLLLCTSLLRASPSLNRFKIKFFDLEKRTKRKWR